MSYDLWLVADLGGPEPVRLDTDWNYTSNCAQMWRAAGADLAEYHDKPASECIPSLSEAIERMKADPATFEAMNPPNGWGSYNTLVSALEELLASFREAPKAIVKVWR